DATVYPEKIVSGYFGPKTLAAVKRFQKKYGISPVSGIVGPLTRAKLAELYGGAVTPATPAVPTEAPAVPATPAQPANAAQISELQALIQSLQSQLNALSAPKPSGGSTSGGCNTALNSNLICLP
ncbi:MAG: peptidoglycan-binding domain-containing protein, partial [bacterium]|nr:peptidoglycan-binding domain-containing protein [bacterium]